MIDYQLLLILFGLVIALILDIIAIACRVALRHSNLARVVYLREKGESSTDQNLDFLKRISQPYAGLHITQSLLHFLLIGLIFILTPRIQRLDTLLEIIGLLVGAGLLLTLIEWVVERRVFRDPETWVFRFAGLIRILTLILFPLIKLSLFFSRETTRSQENPGVVTEDALKTLVDMSQDNGVLEREERQMIHSVFRLGDTLTREIMVPRIDVQALEINVSLPKAIDFLLTSGFSRVPVYHETIDNILGLLYVKDLLRIWREENGLVDIKNDLLRKPYYVPEAKNVDELLAEMRKRRVHMAIVVDEYGGVAGVVTLEDIIEEIFGEIQDEYDEGEELPYQLLESGDYLFRGRVDLDDFNEIMGCDLPSDEADTLGGYIYSRLGHVPSVGENIRVGKLLLTVKLIDNHRIRKVHAHRVPMEK
ncbi:MAG: hemolysin family protein [Chloroflexota bacterium]|nr:hemolysin family protein [Chloroflexota bacterium]